MRRPPPVTQREKVTVGAGRCRVDAMTTPGARAPGRIRWSGLAVALLLAGGCRAAVPAGISVVRRGGDLVFRFGPCGGGDEQARIMDLNVYPLGSAAPVCSLVLTHDPRMTITGQWRYGEIPPAYKAKRCDPLGPGRFRMEVTHATVDFELTADGQVLTRSTACH
jgi:hypothetical protein